MTEPATPSFTFPVNLSLTGLRCLVVGNEAGARERIAALGRAGARVRWVGADSEREPHSERPHFEAYARSFEESDLDDVWLAVLTDQDAELAARIGKAARERRIFFCAVDQPAHGTFAHMALVRVAALTVAISTGGVAPALARKLQQELLRAFDTDAFRAFLARLVDLRARLPLEGRAQKLLTAVSGLRLDVTLPPDGAG